jgi:hypothetical protein
MGSLIPIGGGGDAEIQNLLNTAFNASNIKIIRTKVANEDLLDGNHHLHRIAYRLGAYPIGNYGADDAKGKWFFFLKNILKTAKHNGVSTAASVKKILAYALSHATGADKVVRVVFQAIQGTDPNAEHFVSSASGVATEPGNPTDNADIARLVDTTGTLSLTLVCPAPLPNQSAPVPNQISDVDKDSQGNIIEKKPIKIFTPQDLSPPTLSPLTRKPKGKGAYKGPAKTGKKAKKTKKAKKAKKRK